MEDTMEEKDLERFVADVRIRWGLRTRAVAVLREIVCSCNDDGWYSASEAQLARLVGCSPVTVSRAIKELEKLGLITGHHSPGKSKGYRVRFKVISGEESIPDSVRQETLTALTSDADPGQSDRAQIAPPP
jgi:predicted transcriptional regulator